MIKIISFKICPFVQRITALLEAKKIKYEIKYIDLNNKPTWFLDLSPTGQVPILITESKTPLFESDAIAEYIDDIYEVLEPNISAEQRAINRAWSYQATKHYLIQCAAQRSPNLEALSKKVAILNKAFIKIENQLGNTNFFNSEKLNNVDIAWLVLLHRIKIIQNNTAYNFIKDYPKIQKWQKNLLETGLAEKSVSSDFEQKFTDFYLTNETFLGGNKLNNNKQSSTACC
ncbi:MAG: glutathione S-transferase family protein [Ostreibacterium sp.]